MKIYLVKICDCNKVLKGMFFGHMFIEILRIIIPVLVRSNRNSAHEERTKYLFLNRHLTKKDILKRNRTVVELN